MKVSHRRPQGLCSVKPNAEAIGNTIQNKLGEFSVRVIS